MTEYLQQDRLIWRKIPGLPDDCLTAIISTRIDGSGKEMNLSQRQVVYKISGTYVANKFRLHKIVQKNPELSYLIPKLTFSVKEYDSVTAYTAKGNENFQADELSNVSPNISWGPNFKHKEEYNKPNIFFNLTNRKNKKSNDSEITLLFEDETEFFNYSRNTSDEVLEQIALDLLQLPNDNDDAVEQEMDVYEKTCKGTMAFKCIWNLQSNQLNSNGICDMCQFVWKKCHHSMLGQLLFTEGIKHSTQYLVETLTWTVLPEVGLKMFLQSEDALPAMILPTVVGPICKKCERKTAFICDSETELCERCYHGHQLLNSAKAQPRYFYFDEEQKRDSLTLVFTCKRHSGGIKNVSTEADIFQELEDSFIKSQRSDGPFGKVNRPGYPTKIKFAGRFSAPMACAKSPISEMKSETPNCDIKPLSSLPDYIIGSYYPGDNVVILVSQPASLTISPQHMATFLNGVFLRGIPDDSFYIFCHGLRSINHITPRYETVVSCCDLLTAIRNNITPCGLRPQVNAYIYEMLFGVEARNNQPTAGRNTADSTKEIISYSQENRKKDELENFRDEFCSLSTCKANLGTTFALSCVSCQQWYHGSCANVTRDIAYAMELEGLEWTCNVCLEILGSPV